MLVLEEGSTHQGMTPATFRDRKPPLLLGRNLVNNHEESSHIGENTKAKYYENYKLLSFITVYYHYRYYCLLSIIVIYR